MRTLGLIVSVLVCLLLQVTLAPRITIGHASPDFVVVVVMLVALYRGAVAGSIGGFVVGLFQDLGNPVLLGLNALTKTLLGFAIGRVGEKTFPEHPLFLFAVFAAGAFGHDALYLLFYKWPHMGSTFLMIGTAALPSAFYTAAFGVVIDMLASRSGAKAVALGKKRQQ